LLARCLLSLTVGLGALPVPRARAADTLRLVLRIASDSDRALLPRLRGQLSDVDATLIVAETSVLEAELADQLEVARALATLHHADVIVWCAGAGKERLVHIVLPRAERRLTRQLTGPGNDDDALSSSELETAAVLVRSALLALAQGVELGVPMQEPAAQQPPGSEPKEAADTRDMPAAATQPRAADAPDSELHRSSPAKANAAADSGELPVTLPPLPASTQTHVDHAEPPPPRQPSSTALPLRARLSLGAQLALDGQSSSGQRGLYARVGLSLGAWALYAFGALSLASEIEDPYFALRVARHAVGVLLERQLPLTETLWLGLAVQAGALLFRRTSRAESSGAVSYPASLTAAFALGPELAFGWLPGRFGLSVRIGLDCLPNAPRFETARITPDRSAISHSLWSFEPRIALGVETALP
jgi:hypothetical protein